MNIFSVAMLGRLAVVKSILASTPDMKFSKGPHGLQLLLHAGKRSDSALSALQYLQNIEA